MVAFMRSAWLWLSVGIGLVTACGAPASAPGPVSSAASGLVSTSELDQLIEKVWAEHSVTPASEIDDARRVTLDLAGRVPTSARLQRFSPTIRNKRSRHPSFARQQLWSLPQLGTDAARPRQLGGLLLVTVGLRSHRISRRRVDSGPARARTRVLDLPRLGSADAASRLDQA
jgi:hypothetical protein